MKPSRTLLSLLTVLVVFGALAAGIGWRLLVGNDARVATGGEPETLERQIPTASRAAGAQPVRGAEVIRDTLWIPITATGEAHAYRVSEVATRRAGVVERVLVRENDRVSAGDLLVQLDTADAFMELEQAMSRHLAATTDFETRTVAAGDALEFLGPDELAERRRRVRALSGLDQAELDLEQARRQMEFTRVRAPFAGRVANLRAVEGSYLASGAEVMTLLEVDPVKIEAEVLESEVAYLEPGRRASVRFSSFGDELFEARVESVNPVVDPETRSARVTLVMANPGDRIHHGMYARVVVDAQAYPNRILVPREAVVERNRREVVFVARDLDERGMAIAEWRDVRTGFRNETHVEILLGEDAGVLEAGEIVLVDGHHYLAHETDVQLVDAVPEPAGRPVR